MSKEIKKPPKPKKLTKDEHIQFLQLSRQVMILTLRMEIMSRDFNTLRNQLNEANNKFQELIAELNDKYVVDLLRTHDVDDDGTIVSLQRPLGRQWMR